MAVFLIAITGKLLYGMPIESAAQAAIKLMPINQWVGTFVAIGLFDAGFLGAICISLASSWAWGEVFGWAHSLNHKVREAPWFYAYYVFDLMLAGTVVLIFYPLNVFCIPYDLGFFNDALIKIGHCYSSG